MATIIETFVNEDGDTINIYESGAHYNVTKKRLVKAPPQHAITSEKSARFKAEMAERKRAAVVRGAGRALEAKQPGEWTLPNAEDMVEAVSEAVAIKALDPANPKQVDAARFLFQEAGVAETQTKINADVQQFAQTGAVLAELLGFLRYAMQPGEYIDGQISTPPAITDSDNDTRNE